MSITPPLNSIQKSLLEGEVIECLKTIFDPELPVNIYDLGLIYNVAIQDDGTVQIKMTLTSPNCPVAESLPREVETKVSELQSVASCQLELVWDPPFSIEMIPDHVKLELGLL